VTVVVLRLMFSCSFWQREHTPVLDTADGTAGLEDQGASRTHDFFDLAELAGPDNCNEFVQHRERKHQAQYDNGHYFIMRYDASSRIQDDVRKTLGLDPRMIKFSSVKLGDGTLESLSKIGGSIPWDTREEF